jgi:hypothetical protein
VLTGVISKAMLISRGECVMMVKKKEILGMTIDKR